MDRLRTLLPLVLLLAWPVHASDNGPVIPKAAWGDQCVADTGLMRTDHMKLLNHQRDDTVIDGIRGEPFSLVGCVNCHAQRDNNGQAIRIDAKGQFCEGCHTYAAVKIDCFTCHAALPEEKEIIGFTPAADELLAVHYTSQQKQILLSHKVADRNHGQHQQSR